MEGLNGHFSGWKKPSSWGSPETDARIGFIPHCDQWADNEISWKRSEKVEIVSSSGKSNARWWWGTPKGPPSWANGKMRQPSFSPNKHEGKKTWNMMLSLELVATVWELSDDSLKLSLQLDSSSSKSPQNTESRAKGATWQLYKKIVSPHFKEFAILNSVSQGECGIRK